MIFLDLVQNIALLVALAVGYRVMVAGAGPASRWRGAATGVLFGAVALVGMATPVTLAPGVIFDGRSIVLAVAGLVGGWAAAGTAAVMAAAYRAWIGGTGVAVGIAVITASALLGVAFHFGGRRRSVPYGWAALWLMGYAVHGAMALILLALPADARSRAWPDLWLALVFLYPAAFVLVARLFLDYDRQAREQALLRKGEAQFRTLWESVEDAVFTLDERGRVVFLNPSATRLTGWSLTEAAGAPERAVLTLEDGGGRRLDDPAEAVSTPGAGATPLPPDTWLVSRDGRRTPVSGSCSPIHGADGGYAGAVLTLRDHAGEHAVRERLRESEAWSELALSGADLGTWEWDVVTGALDVDERWAEILGRGGSEAPSDGRARDAWIHPDDRDRVHEALQDHLSDRAPAYQCEYRMRHRAGHWVWVLDRGRVFRRSDDGEPRSLAGTLLDISGERASAERLTAREAQLRSRNQAVLEIMTTKSAAGEGLHSVVGEIVEAATHLLPVARASVWWYGEDFTRVRCVDAFDRGAGRHVRDMEFPCDPSAERVHAHRMGTPFVTFPSTSGSRRPAGFPESYWRASRVGAVLDVPVWIGGEVQGFLSLEHVGGGRTWTGDDERFAALLATQVALARESEDRRRAEEEARTGLEAVQAAEKELRASLDTAERGRLALLSTLEDRASALEALRESEARFRRLAEHAPDLIFRYELLPERGFRYVSPAATDMTGYTPDDHYADPDLGRRLVHPDDAHLLEDPAYLESGEPLVLRWRRADGTVLWTEQRLVPVHGDDGKLVAIEGIARDITERVGAEERLRASEQRFREALDRVPDVVVIYGPDLRIRFINAATAAVTGRSPEEYLGKRDDELWPLEVYGQYLPALEEAAATGATREVEVTLRLEGRDERVLHVTCLPLLDPDGSVRELLGITRDLTEIRTFERETRALTEALEQKVEERTRALTVANAELESFAYSVSHDLKAPLRAIDGYSALLEGSAGGLLSREDGQLLSEVRANAQFMGRLIDDLLSFSRVGRASLETRAVQLSDMIREILDAERAAAEGRTIELVMGPLPEVRADPDLLRQALANILGNAVKFTRPRERARIEVTGVEEDGMVRFGIKDNGVGFDARYAHKAFRVFERLHYQDEFEGTGVGLAIVKRIVERHDGTVAISSAQGEWTAVEFTLPSERSQDGG